MRLLGIIGVLHLVFLAESARYCSYMPAKWEHIKYTSKCCEPSEAQLEMIAWYFQRVSSYVQITEVIPEELHARRATYVSYFLKDLFNYMELEYYTYRVDYKHRDQMADADEPYTRTYKWHAELSQGLNKTHFIEDTEQSFKKKSSGGGDRDDSPDFASVVLAENIETLDNYLNGETRHPFREKRAHYVLLIYREMESSTWDKWASSVMSKLWRDHGILNAVIMSTCKSSDFGYYDPFVNVKSLQIAGVNEWGIFRCKPIKALDFNDSWLLQKEYSMNNFPLTFTIFERYPTMVTTVPELFVNEYYNRGMKTSGYAGIDGLLLGNLAEQMGFTIRIIQPEFEETYGYKLANGSFVGALADVLYGDADVAFNARFLLSYRTNDIEFLLPVLADKVCIIAPAAEKVPQWKAIFHCFNVNAWFSFAIITFISSLCFLLIKLWRDKQEMSMIRDTIFYKEFKHLVVEEKSQCRRMFWTTWKVMIGITDNMPTCTVERLLIGSCLIANLIIIGTFESSLYTAYTRRSYYKNIDTLEELDESNLIITYTSPTLLNLFGNRQSATDVMRSLKRKTILDNGESISFDRTAYERDVCSVERLSDVDIIIKTKYVNYDGTPLLHVIKECPRHYFLTYIVRKGWPLLPRFNQVMTKFAEAGFIQFWYETTKEAFITHRNIKTIKSNQDTRKPFRKPFSLQDIQTSFYFLIIGYIIATIVFLIEKFVLPPNRINQSKIYLSRWKRTIMQRWKRIFG